MEDDPSVNAPLRGSTWSEGAAEKRHRGQQIGAGSGREENANAAMGHHGLGRRGGGGYGGGRASVMERNAAPKGAKSSNAFRILIAIVVLFFLMETIGNGLVFLRLRETDLQAGSLDIFPRAGVMKADVAAGDGARFVPRVLVERLLLSRGRATLAELRKEVRAPMRPPRLALVCISCSGMLVW